VVDVPGVVVLPFAVGVELLVVPTAVPVVPGLVPVVPTAVPVVPTALPLVPTGGGVLGVVAGALPRAAPFRASTLSGSVPGVVVPGVAAPRLRRAASVVGVPVRRSAVAESVGPVAGTHGSEPAMVGGVPGCVPGTPGVTVVGDAGEPGWVV
jgi:hypothetical protein